MSIHPAPSVVIAEAGTNHLGSLNSAKNLAEIAASCGADVIKFQCFTRNVSPLTMFCWIDGDENRSARWRESAMSFIEWYRLKEFCDDIGIELLLSCFELKTVRWQEPLGLKVYKVASRAWKSYPYFTIPRDAMCLVSDGMADGKMQLPDNMIRMQCTAEYPAEVPWKGDPKTGYSCHSAEEFLAIDALSRGCRIVEVHFHHARWLAGPDEPVTKNADQLMTICRARNYYDRQRLGG